MNKKNTFEVKIQQFEKNAEKKLKKQIRRNPIAVAIGAVAVAVAGAIGTATTARRFAGGCAYVAAKVKNNENTNNENNENTNNVGDNENADDNANS